MRGNKDYVTGVSLYTQYGENTALKKTFNSGPNSYTIKKLYEELSKLEHSGDDEEIVLKKKNTKLPEDIKKLKSNALDMYKDMNHIHEHLEDEGLSDEQRKNMAKQILELDDKKTAAFEAVDHFEEKGTRTPAGVEKSNRGKDVKEMSKAELIKALSAYPTYISKTKKQLENKELKPQSIATLQSRLQQYIDDLAYIKKELGL